MVRGSVYLSSVGFCSFHVAVGIDHHFVSAHILQMRLGKIRYDGDDDWGDDEDDRGGSKKGDGEAPNQYGVKGGEVQDRPFGGELRKQKKSEKDRNQKFNNELHKINKIIDQRKNERSGGNLDDLDMEYDLPSKKMRFMD